MEYLVVCPVGLRRRPCSYLAAAVVVSGVYFFAVTHSLQMLEYGILLAVTLPQLLFFRCTTIVGVCVEYIAGVAWVAELFPNPKQRETVLGYAQAAFGLGGLMVTAAYYLAVTYAERFPAIHGQHQAWRYTLLSGLVPALPLILARPFLPESPIWRTKKSTGTLKRSSFVELFRPALRSTTLVTTFLVACSYALASGVILQTPRLVPGLPEMHGLAPGLVEQTVSRVQLFQEVGTIAGRLMFAFLVIRIVAQRRLLRVFLIPGLIVFSGVYFFAATHSLQMLEYGILLAGLLLNGRSAFGATICGACTRPTYAAPARA